MRRLLGRLGATAGVPPEADKPLRRRRLLPCATSQLMQRSKRRKQPTGSILAPPPLPGEPRTDSRLRAGRYRRPLQQRWWPTNENLNTGVHGSVFGKSTPSLTAAHASKSHCSDLIFSRPAATATLPSRRR